MKCSVSVVELEVVACLHGTRQKGSKTVEGLHRVYSSTVSILYLYSGLCSSSDLLHIVP